jgi:hypothetical protein
MLLQEIILYSLMLDVIDAGMLRHGEQIIFDIPASDEG